MSPSVSGSKMAPRQIGRFVVGLCFALPVGMIVCGFGVVMAAMILVGLFTVVTGEAKVGKPWAGVLIANLLGLLIPPVIRRCCKMHPVATLKRKVSLDHKGGIFLGLVEVMIILRHISSVGRG